MIMMGTEKATQEKIAPCGAKEGHIEFASHQGACFDLKLM